jgi:hypothetical protein
MKQTARFSDYSRQQNVNFAVCVDRLVNTGAFLRDVLTESVSFQGWGCKNIPDM